jgi:hypothetical protein
VRYTRVGDKSIGHEKKREGERERERGKESGQGYTASLEAMALVAGSSPQTAHMGCTDIRTGAVWQFHVATECDFNGILK